EPPELPAKTLRQAAPQESRHKHGGPDDWYRQKNLKRRVGHKLDGDGLPVRDRHQSPALQQQLQIHGQDRTNSRKPFSEDRKMYAAPMLHTMWRVWRAGLAVSAGFAAIRLGSRLLWFRS